MYARPGDMRTCGSRINAAVRPEELLFRFMQGLTKAGVEINRKLVNMAIEVPQHSMR